MRISLPCHDLTRVLAAVTKVVEARNTIPILSNVLLSVADGTLTVRGTDLDIDVVAATQVLDATDGAITVPAKVLADIAKKVSADISLTVEDDLLIVKSGRSRFKLQTLPAEDYPDIRAGEFSLEFELDIAEAVASVQFAMSSDAARYYLNGVHLAGTADSLTAVATDGHRLSRRVLPSVGEFPGIIVPRKLVSILPKGKAKVAVSERQIRITAEDVVMTSKLIDGTFPDYARVIPNSNDKHVAVDRDALLAAVERVTVVSNERGSAVKFEVASDSLSLSVKDDANDEIEAGYSGEPMSIGFNGSYVSDILRAFRAGTVTFQFADSGSPARIVGEPEGLDCVLMPMRA